MIRMWRVIQCEQFRWIRRPALWVLLAILVAICGLTTVVEKRRHALEIQQIEKEERQEAQAIRWPAEERGPFSYIPDPDLKENIRSLNAYRVSGRILSFGTVFLLFLFLVIGSLSLSSEDQLGTFRITAIRPVRRTHLFSGKLLFTIGVMTTYYLVLVLLAFFMAGQIGTWGDVYPDMMYGSREPALTGDVLASSMKTAILLGWGTLVAGVCFSVFVSSWMKSAGASVAAVLLTAFLAQYVIAGVLPDFSAYLFTDYLEYPFAKIGALAQGFADEQLFEDDPRSKWAWWVCSIWAGVLALAGWLRFTRRDILS